jgi:hypothetical protein
MEHDYTAFYNLIIAAIVIGSAIMLTRDHNK